MENEMQNRLTPYEIFNHLRTAMATTAAACYEYDNWDAKFCKEYIKQRYDNYVKQLSSEEYDNVKIRNLTIDELKSLGFSHWTQKDNLLLAPLWIVPFLQIDKEQQYYFIDGERFTFKDNFKPDNDIRFGCVAWGIKK